MAQQTILVIEDDADIVNIVTVILTEAGYTVRTGRDVSDLYEIEKDPPSLILLDNWLDGKTGHDICFNLKTTPKTSGIPVVLFSATANLKETAESCKADGYIAKPFDREELLAVIGQQLN